MLCFVELVEEVEGILGDIFVVVLDDLVEVAVE